MTDVLADHKLWLAGKGGARADLTEANLAGADLTWANLTEANLAEANLAGADLTGAELAGAHLTWAHLAGANLAGADLTWANLAGANLAGADLAGADLTRANCQLILRDDGRGFGVHVDWDADGNHTYRAGCRSGWTVETARRHWGNPDHQAPESAKRILDAIEWFEEGLSRGIR